MAREEKPQFIGMTELSASFATEKGEIIISGCSHSTIETIIQETLRIRKTNIYLVVFGDRYRFFGLGETLSL